MGYGPGMGGEGGREEGEVRFSEWGGHGGGHI